MVAQRKAPHTAGYEPQRVAQPEPQSNLEGPSMVQACKGEREPSNKPLVRNGPACTLQPVLPHFHQDGIARARRVTT